MKYPAWTHDVRGPQGTIVYFGTEEECVEWAALTGAEHDVEYTVTPIAEEGVVVTSPLPTDEDREALDKAIFYTDPTGAKVFRWADDRVVVGEDSFILGLPDAILAAGFRRSVVSTPDPEALARRFHEAYERLAPEFGYKTREASAVPWEDVPDANKRLMIATCAAVSAPPTITEPARITLASRRGGKTQVLIDAMLAQANERGIAVEIVPLTITDEAVERAEFILRGGDDPWIEFDDGVVRAALRAALGGEA